MSETWDQVLAFGEYQHVTVDGTPVDTVFDASRCRVMLDDFAARTNDIFIDKRHEVVDEGVGVDTDGNIDLAKLDEWAKGSGETDGRALGWADALCMVVAGQIVRYERHSTAPSNPPTIEQLRRPNGSLPEDGVYARRSVVTPLGADPKEGFAVYRSTSPYFVPLRDGWRLLNYTATNDPRMDGPALGEIQAMESCRRIRMGSAVAMSRTRKAETMPMDQPKDNAAIMTAAGVMEDDKPEDKMAKLLTYAAKMEEERRKAEEARKKMEDDSEAMRRKMEEEEEKRACARKAEEEERRKFEDDHKEPDGDEGKQQMQAMSRKQKAQQEVIDMLKQELAEVKGSASEFQAMQREQKKQTATAWAKQAIAMRRVKPTRKGSVEDTEKWLVEQRLADPNMAEELLCDEGTFGVSEPLVMERHTFGSGAPVGSPNPRADMSVDDEMDAAISAQTKAMKAEGVDFKKIDVHRMAMQRIKDKNPNLYGRYVRAGSN